VLNPTKEHEEELKRVCAEHQYKVRSCMWKKWRNAYTRGKKNAEKSVDTSV